jgi:hypothetical protein
MLQNYGNQFPIYLQDPAIPDSIEKQEPKANKFLMSRYALIEKVKVVSSINSVEGS